MKSCLFALAVLCVAQVAIAQTPTVVKQATIAAKFHVSDANAYNSGKLDDGVTAIVQAVEIDAVGMNNNGAIAISYVLPIKPPADANGDVGPVQIGAGFVNATLHKPYIAIVSLIGPDGVQKSPASLPFVLSAPMPPPAASNLIIQ